MFLLAYFCWLCLVNSFLAYPLNQYKEPDFRYGFSPGQADYPDLTHGLSDAEVRETLSDLTLDDLKSLDHVIIEHINEREEENKASLRRQSLHSSHKNFRAVDPTLDDNCQEENDCDEPKQVTRCKTTTCATTKRCTKTTCAPKTTRTTRPSCVPKTTCASEDVFAKCPKANNKSKRKKPKEDNECASDDYQCLARKRMEKSKNVFQDLDMPEYAPASENGEQIGSEPLDEDSHLDYPKESRLTETAELHENLGSRKHEHLANFDASLEGEHHNHKLQHKRNLKLDHVANFQREQEANLKKIREANGRQINLARIQQNHWTNKEQGIKTSNLYDTEQADSDHIKLSTWAKLDPANLANIEEANFDLSNWGNADQVQFRQEQNDHFEQGKQANFHPAQEQQAKFQQENQYNFKQDNQASLEQCHPAKRELVYQGNSEQENRANVQLQNQESFEQTHRDRQMRDYHQDELHHQDREMRSEVNVHPSAERAEGESVQLEPYERHQLSRKRNAKQENRAFRPQGETYREQRSEVNYHPHTEQWHSSQTLTNQAELNKMEAPLQSYEGQQLYQKRNAEQKSQALKPQSQTHREQRSKVNYQPNTEYLNKMESQSLEPYEGHQLYQKRSSELEKTYQKRRVPMQNKGKIVTKNDESQPLKADFSKQQSHLDAESFIANNARDPPRYLTSLQNDRIQRENVERRLNEDRSLSESLNLDKLAGEKDASPAGESEWTSDNKRGKRENRSSDDAQENSRETYLKKLMDSFPRDQGSQINANVALKDCPFAHERMKRS